MARHFRALVALALAGCLAAPGRRAGAEAPVPPRADDLFDKSHKAAVEALKVYGRWEDPAQQRRVAEIGYRVAQESGYRDYPITFALVDLAEPNAFALPAGQIFVTRGMLALGLEDDELAALLGHEIAHVVHRHGVRMERRATLLNVLAQAVMVGVMIGTKDRDNRPVVPEPWGVDSRPTGSGDFVYGSYAASIVLSELLLRSYSREYEDESDQDGQRWAAAAGYAPDGTARLMNRLGSRLPESREYGYWRTHPFFAQRVVAAGVRGRDLARGEAKPTAEYRSWTQRRVLDLGASQTAASEGALLIESLALTAWPEGTEAERLRLERLHRARAATLERPALSRDYGALLAIYDGELAELAGLTASERLVARLRSERAELATQAEELYAQARTTWSSGVYETAFLASFLSNWPAAPETPEVALALGEAYGRTARQADAVAMFLRALAAGPETAAGQRALRGLRNLAPGLEQLTALAELAEQSHDEELARLATERLARLAGSYDDVAVGAAYLARYPAGPHVDAVTARLNVLAENLYGEVLLYQGVGDHVRAIDRIQRILTHAPGSPAAQKLLDHVVLPT